jgi:GNAT superfamily N-acetyltransferase
MNFQIERADPKDFAILTEIAKLSKASLGYSSEVIRIWESELSVSSEMIANFISFVAKDQSQIVGFWCREAVNGLSDGRLFILPNYQRKGCGRLLWNAVLKECKRRELTDLAWEADYQVLPFYLKMGAKLIGEKKSDYFPELMIPIIGISI